MHEIYMSEEVMRESCRPHVVRSQVGYNDLETGTVASDVARGPVYVERRCHKEVGALWVEGAYAPVAQQHREETVLGTVEREEAPSLVEAKIRWQLVDVEREHARRR